jgi:clan AA aspartic protease
MIVGTVDARGRPLVPLVVFHPGGATQVTLEGWVDTGFLGNLILPQKLVTNMGLPFLGTKPVILAGAVPAMFRTYECQIEWFGVRQTLEVMASADPLPLIGFELLKGHRLTVDYVKDTVLID